jgi:hypothetical protein
MWHVNLQRRTLNCGSERKDGCVAGVWLVRNKLPITEPAAVSRGDVAHAGDACRSEGGLERGGCDMNWFCEHVR